MVDRMRLWEIQKGSKVRVYPENLLLRRLAVGELSGDDPIRAVGESAWRPLRSVPDFTAAAAQADAQGHSGSRSRSLWLSLQAVVIHAAVWAGVSFLFHLSRVAVIGWGVAVAIHAVTSLVRLFSGGGRSALPSEASSIPALPSSDGFLDELSTALQALEQAAKAKGMLEGFDLAALRKAAADLRRQHLAMATLAEPAARDRLTQERNEVLAQAERSQDPRTIEVLRDQAQSVTEQLTGLQQAADAAARLQARERTLLHQIEALRLSLMQSGVDEVQAPDLAAEVQKLQLDLKAEAEVETGLAQARIAPGQAQRN